MRIRDWFASANRFQQRLLFKVVATAAILLVAAVGMTAYTIWVQQAGDTIPAEVVPEGPGIVPAPPDPAMEATKAIVKDILAARRDVTSVAVGIALSAGVLIAAVWLGLGLTYLSLGLLAAGMLAGAWNIASVKPYLPLVMGLLGLTAAFSTLMQLARMGVSRSNAVMAIARNVLAEAVRLRLSLFFIVLLIFLLAALPLLLNAEAPLRYRMQQFLQWGTSGSFYLIAMLTVLFGVATVTFDQRDKTIWQTITKPVSPWQYVAGKWLGVWVLAGVLLAVTGAGVFMFVEYLRSQPANGEGEAYVTQGGSISEDRLLLERHVLVARVSRDIDPMQVDEEQLIKNIEVKAAQEIERVQGAVGEAPIRKDELVAKIKADVRKMVQQQFRSIPPGAGQGYQFSGLGAARESRAPVFLRFKVNAGSNDPTALYRITIRLGNSEHEVKQIILGQFTVINLLPEVVDENGTVTLDIINGDLDTGALNPESISFPPDGLELSYSDGTFRANFMRVLCVMWVKLAFLAMLGVCMGTFLSFPVACMVSVAVFLAAEGAAFVQSSLENYWTEDKEGKTLYLNIVVSAIAESVSWFFKAYSDLRPTTKLAEGLRLSWTEVAGGAAMALLFTLILFLAGTISLKRRELAIYSGQ
ncbi:hypothetical protein PHYC_01214 [Phycisphaerales bacterium]|nr:hypothetical protein PHYC_01214 [Phycisphaerales bacterium]